MSKQKNFFRPVRATEVDTKIAREQLEKDIEDFLARGGVIEVLGAGDRKGPMIDQQKTLTHRQIAEQIAKRRAAKRGTDEKE